MIRCLLVLLLNFSFSFSAPALPVARQTPTTNPLLGAWQSENGKDAVLFEANRCRFKTETDPLQFCRVSYRPGKVVLHVYGRSLVVSAQVSSKTLILIMPGEKQAQTHYRKREGIPAMLTLPSLTPGKTIDLSPQKVKLIQKELARRSLLDQNVRTHPDQEAQMQKVDRENTSYLIALIKEIGWVDLGRFGNDASLTAFLIVQHSGNVPLTQVALPIIKKEVLAKRLDSQQYALLYDRLQMLLGLKQRYGTQVGADEQGKVVVLALENLARVDEFRKEIGLNSLNEYLQFFSTDGEKKVGFEKE